MASPGHDLGRKDEKTTFVKGEEKRGTFDIGDVRVSIQNAVQQALENAGIKADAGRGTVIGELARSSLTLKNEKLWWKKTTLRVCAVLALGLIAIFGLMMWAVDLQKDTQMDHGALTAKDSKTIVQTAPSQQQLGLRVASVIDWAHLEDVHTITYTFAHGGKRVAAQVLEASRESIEGTSHEMTVFHTSRGHRVLVTPDRLAYIPGDDAVAATVVWMDFKGESVASIIDATGLDFDEVSAILAVNSLCSPGLDAGDDAAPAGLRCSAFQVDDPGLDLSTLNGKVAALSRRLDGDECTPASLTECVAEADCTCDDDLSQCLSACGVVDVTFVDLLCACGSDDPPTECDETFGEGFVSELSEFTADGAGQRALENAGSPDGKGRRLFWGLIVRAVVARRRRRRRMGGGRLDIQSTIIWFNRNCDAKNGRLRAKRAGGQQMCVTYGAIVNMWDTQRNNRRRRGTSWNR